MNCSIVRSETYTTCIPESLTISTIELGIAYSFGGPSSSTINTPEPSGKDSEDWPLMSEPVRGRTIIMAMISRAGVRLVLPVDDRVSRMFLT